MQWLIESLERRLQTLFAMLAPGAQLRYALTAPPPTPEEEWMWWEQPFDVAPEATVTVGLSAAAGQEICTAMWQCGMLATLPSEGAQATVLRMIGNACTVLTVSPCGAGRTLDAAPQTAPSVFTLELTPRRRHSVAVSVSPALAEALEAEARSAEPKDPPGAMPVLLNLDLPVSISLGRARLPIRELLRLSTGSVVELDRTLGEAVDVTINDSVIARGEIVVVEGNYGVRIQSVSGTACRSFAGFPRSS